ncbi:hypothetical protein ACW4TU_18570 [Streptomyces sp. QTS52]
MSKTPLPSGISPGTKAVISAAEELTLQVRRIANALTTPTAVIRDGVLTPLNAATTAPPATCSAQYMKHAEVIRNCIRVAHHIGTGRPHTDEQGFNWSDTVAVYPTETQTISACNEPGPWGDAHACIRPAGHTDDHEAHDGCGWRTGMCDSGHHRQHPGFSCPEVDQTRPYWNARWEHEQGATTASDPTDVWTPDPPIGCLLPTQAPPATTCSARYALPDYPLGECIRTAGHAADTDHTDNLGRSWTDRAAVYPLDPYAAREAPAEGAPLATCRTMETRTCPASYAGPCGERPCARFESDDPTPWLDTDTDKASYYRQLSAEQGQALARAETSRAEAQRDRDQHAAVLTEVLATFGPMRDTHDGPVSYYDGSADITPEQFERWSSVVAPTVERPWWQTVTELREELKRAEAERDGAYRERAQLLALLSALHPSVIAPAPDVDEDGWQILYLQIGGTQASWHIAPRDTELYKHVEYVTADDRRAQWDGHTTEEKYAHIGQHAARLYAEARGRTETPAHERYRFATTWAEYEAGRRAALAESTQEQS